jgi:hypothetical protein
MENPSSTTWSENQPKDSRMASKRRRPRMNCRVPLSIAWNSIALGSHHLETAFTRVVNAYGCLLVSPIDMELHQRLRVINLRTLQETDAEVVWKGTQRLDGWDLGIKLIEEQTDFWGVEF